MRTLAALWLTLCALLLVTADDSRADWITNGIPLCQAVDSHEVLNDVAMVARGGGGVIVIWGDGRASDSDIYAQGIDDYGNIWAADGVPICVKSNGQGIVSAVPDGTGGAIVVWSSYDLFPAGFSLNMQRITADGTALWTPGGVEIVAADPTVPGLTASGLVADGAGGAFLQRLEFLDKIDATGAIEWTVQYVTLPMPPPGDSTPGMTLFPLGLVSDMAGGVIASWYHVYEDSIDGPDPGLWGFVEAQRLDGSGQKQWGPDGVAVFPGYQPGRGYDPATISDGNGGAVIYYSWIDSLMKYGEVVQRLDQNGLPLWAGNDRADISNRMVADGTGGAIFAAQPFAGTTDIYALGLDSLGVDRWLVPVCTDTMTTGPLEIVPDGYGGAIIAWRDNRHMYITPTPPYWDEIYAQRVGHDGAVQWATNGVPVRQVPFSVYETIGLSGPFMTHTDDGAIVAWWDPRDISTTQHDLYAQRVYLSGTVPTAAGDVSIPTPALHQNFPNPFNPETTVRYDVAKPGAVSIRIYDVRGALVRVLEERDRSPGRYEAAWDGRNDRGKPVPSGVYFYQLTAPGCSQTRKMVLIK